MKEKKTLKELHFKIKFHFILFYIVQTDLLIGGKIDLFFSQRYNTLCISVDTVVQGWLSSRMCASYSTIKGVWNSVSFLAAVPVPLIVAYYDNTSSTIGVALNLITGGFA